MAHTFMLESQDPPEDSLYCDLGFNQGVDRVSIRIDPSGFSWDRKCFTATMTYVSINGEDVASKVGAVTGQPTVEELLGHSPSWKVCR